MTNDATVIQKRSFLDNLGLVVGLMGSAVTIALTILNTHTKQQIDDRELVLKEQQQRFESAYKDRQLQVDALLKQHTADLEDNKDRVERLKWVYLTLVPAINTSQPPRTQNAALAMIRLVLTDIQAKDLLLALQQSPDKTVAQAADVGARALDKIEMIKLVELVRQMNADSVDVRKHSTGQLESQYKDSDLAVSLVLERIGAEHIQEMSKNGLINSLYYLSRTDLSAWSQDNQDKASKVISLLRSKNIGSRTSEELTRLESVVTAARKASTP